MNKLIYFHSKGIKDNKANAIQVLEMCNAFAKAGFNVDLYFPHDGTSENKTTEIIKDKLGVSEFSFKIVRYNPIHIFGRLKFLYPMFVYLTNKDALFFLRDPYSFYKLAIFKRKIIYEAHYILDSKEFGPVSRRMILLLMKMRHVKTIVCISNALADWYAARGISREKLLVLHDGVNPDVFTPTRDVNYYKKLLKFSVDTKIFTYAGSLDGNRNIEIIFDCAEKFTNLFFVIIGGSGSDLIRMQLILDSKAISNVLLLGYLQRRKMIEYIWASDYLLMLWSKDVVTIDYCSPLKTFEYMASRRNIIGHNFPTIREVLQNEVDAILIDPDSPSALIKTIQRVIDDGFPSAMVANSYKKMIQNFTWRKRADIIFQTYMSGNDKKKNKSSN